VHQILLFIDRLSMWAGKTFAWCIIILTFGVSYEVFVRYVLGAPTTWAYDISYMMYGALFLMAGAYTVSRNGHVRGDFLYRLWPPRVQAIVDLALYVLFYLPGIGALIYAGTHFSRMSWRFGEVSVFSPANIPIFPMKTLIPIAGVLLLLQGISEILRCIECIRFGHWPARLQDVEEMESAILHAHEDELRKQHSGAAQEPRR
jgi:TRAP-type mannitol/chloroaromatic compound transport system permease small subunit